MFKHYIYESEEEYLEELSLDELKHYGMPRRSGRYPWGSGEDPYQHGSTDFLSRVEELKKSGWKVTAENVKKEFGENVTLNDFRNELSWANYERRLLQVEKAKSLKADGLGATEIGRRMGINESTVRSLLNEKSESKMREVQATTDFLKKAVDEKKMVDVSAGVELELNVSKERIDLALYKLKGEGYEVYSGGIPQINAKGQQTTQKVLCVPGTKHSEIYNYDQVGTVKDYISRDGGKTYERKFYPPASLDSKRLLVLTANEKNPTDGEPGIAKDGIIQIRRGVADLSLGESKYSQVRILVDNDKYLKGMAVYADNMPDGIDVIFNSNKSTKEKALKPIKTDDPTNPFGSLIKDADQGGQYWYDADTGQRCSAVDPNVKNKKLGLINKRADEGDWDDWQDALPAQFLSKQSRALAKKQLDLAKVDKYDEFDEICKLNNPTVKKHLLEKFADGCDAAAVHLKAAALPGQKYHVIIPINTLKDTEIYAPKYDNGTKLALVRYPHGGTFEIPIVTVNNKNAKAKEIIGPDSIDAVGINKKVADRLSGADFDGDTVMCIPTHDPSGKVKINSTKLLDGLKGFDPQLEYAETPGMKYMKDPVTGKSNTQMEMGKISNLITDMTLVNADADELARAVRHSMVVIDAEKHKLDYKRSEIENNIDGLKKKYQVKGIDEEGNVVRYGGAATIISRAKGQYTVDRRQGTPKVNQKGKEWYDPTKPEGAKIYKTADDLYYPDRTSKNGVITYKTKDGKKVSFNIDDKEAYDYYNPVPVKDPNDSKRIIGYTNKTGEIEYKLKTKHQKSTRMAEADDAYELLSEARHPMELLYADYANSMKALGNQARKEMVYTGNLKYDPAAKKVYAPEVASLNNKLKTSLANASRERAALRQANVQLQAYKKDNPTASGEDIRKKGQQFMNKAREDVASVSRSDRSIKITDREWEAIQAGAISESTLKKILNNTDIDVLREKATPRNTTTLSEAKISKIKHMQASNFTIEDIAKACGVSTSTVTKYMKGAK